MRERSTEPFCVTAKEMETTLEPLMMMNTRFPRLSWAACLDLFGIHSKQKPRHSLSTSTTEASINREICQDAHAITVGNVSDLSRFLGIGLVSARAPCFGTLLAHNKLCYTLALDAVKYRACMRRIGALNCLRLLSES